MRSPSFLKQCFVIAALSGVALWMMGCAKATPTAPATVAPTTSTPNPLSTTTGAGAEVPEPVAATTEKPEEPPKTEAPKAEEAKKADEAKPDEKKPE